VSAVWGHDKACAIPMFGMQATDGSATVRGYWTPMRQASAAALAVQMQAAAAKWKIGVEQLRTASSHVYGPDGKQATYGSLVGAAAKLKPPAKPPLKDPSNFRILGQPLHRLDTPAKVNGSARFGIDAASRHARRGDGARADRRRQADPCRQVRPNGCEPRAVKRRPKPHRLLTKPRHVERARLEKRQQRILAALLLGQVIQTHFFVALGQRGGGQNHRARL
jgi:hypothetical protein